jgi:phosphosulfolactate synthase (CoM biosynthesis protein A)
VTKRALEEIFHCPQPPPKPRQYGRNMCMDDGLGVGQTLEVFELVGPYIDSIRICRASAALFPESWLRAKAKLCREFQVDMLTGGPLYQVAVARDQVRQFLEEASALGFTSVEFEQSVIDPPLSATLEHLKIAQDLGLNVVFEYGRKYPDGQPFVPEQAADLLHELLGAGVSTITLERSEIDLVIDQAPEVLVRLAELVGLDKLNFEAGPRKHDYPAKLFGIFDPAEVNLGNICLEPPGAPDSIRVIVNARHGLDRSAGYRFITDLWKEHERNGAVSEVDA